MSQTQPEGYLALPPAGTGRPVLVLHPWWGLNDTIRAFCDRLAEAGFVVFAPDLYHGKVTDQIPEAEALARSLDSNKASAEVSQAVSFLMERSGSDASGVAVIGFSLGAAYALDVSASEADRVHSVVVFYGVNGADFTQSKAEYLGHFAENDPYEPQESVQWLENELKQAGRSMTFYNYPGTGHWFFESDRSDAYNQEAASLAWDRTVEFLKRSLSS
jgi:carboxymethylenebutenolidase